MIELATATSREFGFGSQEYDSDDERKAALADIFKGIKAKSKIPTEDFISFDEWIEYGYEHFCIMAKDLDPTLTGAIPPTARESAAIE